MTRKKLLIPAASALLLTATLAAAVEWNEVPLADHTYFPDRAETGYQEGVYEIPVPAWSALEYKLAVAEGEVIVYEWETDQADPQGLSAEFHGHTEPGEDETGTVMFYKIHDDGRESGALRAPFSGIHGWYLNNESDEDIVVTLKVSGFYEEVPGQ